MSSETARRSRRALQKHREGHRSARESWLRAAVLGADDGVVSTAAILLGVAATSAAHGQVITAGLAGLVAGAASMAAGEYVSVSSQRDAEKADIATETGELHSNPEGELRELAQIYEGRGLDSGLAMAVAVQLSERNRLESHLRDELGIDATALSNPLQAAAFSAGSFTLAGALPLIAFALLPHQIALSAIVITALLSLAIFGSVGGYLGGASMFRAAARVVVGGGVAMGVTALIGTLFHLAGS